VLSFLCVLILTHSRVSGSGLQHQVRVRANSPSCTCTRTPAPDTWPPRPVTWKI